MVHQKKKGGGYAYERETKSGRVSLMRRDLGERYKRFISLSFIFPKV